MHPVRLGGEEGLIVEIDESLFKRRNHNRGRAVVEQWMFGIWDRQERCGYIAPVADRTVNTLLGLIRMHILPGTIIRSNMWRGYARINAQGIEYEHRKVNLSPNFVDPETGVHTNGVEAIWSRAEFKAMHGTQRDFILEYTMEYMFAKGHKDTILEAFWDYVHEYYPLARVEPDSGELSN